MVAVDGVRAVLVTPRAEIRPQAKPLALIPVRSEKDFVPGGAIPPANQTGGALAEDAGCIAIAVQPFPIFVHCHVTSSCAGKAAGKPAALQAEFCPERSDRPAH